MLIFGNKYTFLGLVLNISRIDCIKKRCELLLHQCFYLVAEIRIERASAFGGYEPTNLFQRIFFK